MVSAVLDIVYSRHCDVVYISEWSIFYVALASLLGVAALLFVVWLTCCCCMRRYVCVCVPWGKAIEGLWGYAPLEFWFRDRIWEVYRQR